MQVSFKKLTENESVVELQSSTKINNVIRDGKSIFVKDQCFSPDDNGSNIQKQSTLIFTPQGNHISVKIIYVDNFIFEVKSHCPISNVTVDTRKKLDSVERVADEIWLDGTMNISVGTLTGITMNRKYCFW